MKSKLLRISRYFRSFTGVATFFALLSPVIGAETTNVCRQICGRWQLSAAQSESLPQALDAAFGRYKVPRKERIRPATAGDLESLVRVDAEEALGPRNKRPPAEQLREDLVLLLTPPPSIAITAAGTALKLLGGRDNSEHTPSETIARVDEEGTARIRASWKANSFVVEERYDRKRKLTRSYSTQSDGSLVLAQVITRPGLPAVRLRSIYHQH
jgi:hypothetical protein